MWIASSSVLIASFRSAFCASRKVLRSRDVRQLVERGQVDRAERGDLAVDAVDLALQAAQLARCRPRSTAASASRSTCACGQLLHVLRAAELRGLLLELQLGDALAQRLAGCARAQALLVGARAACADRSSYSLRVAASALLALELQRQRRPAGRPARRRRSGRRARAASCAPAARWRPPAARPSRCARCSSPRRAASARAANCASCAWRSSARSCSRASASLRSASITRLVELGMALLRRRPAACRAPRSAPRRRRGARSAPRAGASISASSSSSCSRRALAASACCVRRSSSTCSWCARVCASAASRRAPTRRCEASV